MQSKPRLAIISSHPIQYNAPWFALLAKEDWIEVKVFYTWSQRQADLHDHSFGKEIKWDIPLLEGYEYAFVDNKSGNPGNQSFKGIDCPDLIPNIKKWNATHLLVFGWNYKSHLAAMRHFKGRIPVIFRGDSTLLDEKPGLKVLARRMLLRWVYRFADYALYVGQANKEYYLRHGMKTAQLIRAPHAIDNNRFTDIQGAGSQHIGQIRKELNITDERDKVIIFVGKFEAKKDPLLLIEAFQKLKKDQLKHEALRLVFVGNGALEEEMKKKANADPAISFLPFQNQGSLPLIYRLGTLLCLPSSGPGETWGLVVNEAMACGVKCVVSDKAGSSSDLGTYPGNHVFKSGDAGDLAAKLEIAIDEAALENKKFLEKWSFEMIIHGIKQIIQADE